ncbi:SAV_2336 N-terminal domain-related protein [Streptomyces sp. enrichment culture]|uniref:SAV_2336 N-terminal domain-related protein n=1 Tax=Streptomyces sp. enrichment culture TaxID=1795815 RepID=UPI003F563838
MPAGSCGPREPLARLADVLAEASGSGVRPSPRELAELLWLAGRMPDGEARDPQQAPGAPDAKDTDAPGRTRDAVGTATPDEVPRQRPEAPAGTPPPPPRAPLHLPAPAPSPSASDPAPHAAAPRHASLRAPVPPMLRHPLGLQRALRPLKRGADAPTGHELDERATAERIARLGATPQGWLPVLRPARERWLRLHLVHDTGPTMPVWRPLVAELHTALAQSGVFRTVTLHRAGPDGTVRGHAARGPADGRTVTLLVSDCMGPQWRKGPAADGWYDTLRHWARRMPVALVQPLPEHLWRDTALPTTAGRLSSPYPAAPTAALTFTPYDEERDGEAGIPLPVLEPEPAWLANWASLIASPGGTAHPAAVARLGAAPPAPDGLTDLTHLSPEELVLRFRAKASPEAFRLAGHVALGRPHLPVMRLVQAALEPDPRPQHLAELILSGLLTAVVGPPGSYAFRPGVQELLLRAVPRTDRLRTTDLLERVGALIDSRAGRARGEFTASTPAAGGTRTPADGEAFATVSEESVRRLTGTEHLDGVRLYDLLEPNGHRLPPPVLVSVGAQLARAVRAAHDAGTAYNGLDPYRVVLLPDGRVELTVAPQPTDAAAREQDLWTLGQMLWWPAEHLPRPLRTTYERTLNRLSRGETPALDELMDPALARAAREAYPQRGYQVLRPLRIHRDRRHPLPGLPPAVRALLAMLLLRHGRYVTPEELRAGMWDPADEPRDPLDAVTRAADFLRSLLSPHAAVATGTAGFALHTSADHVDLVHCEDLARRAERARRDGDLAAARGLLDEALDLWDTGTPLPDVPGPAARAARERLLRLWDDLLRTRAALGGSPRPAPSLVIAADTLTGRPEARIALENAVHETLARGALTPQHYEVTVRQDGYAVRTAPDADLLPVLVAALRTLPEAMAGLREAPSLTVTFQDAPEPPVGAPFRIAVPPRLYGKFAASSAAQSPQRFRPLYGEAGSGPLSWYCLLRESGAPLTPARDLLSGPHIVRDPRTLAVPDPGLAALVQAPPDAPLAPLDPVQRRTTTYYEVDLTPQSATLPLTLPSSGKDGFTADAELSWHVCDPVAFVHGGPARILPRLLVLLKETAGRVSRRHAPRHAAGAERAVNAALREWSVPGLAVSCSVRLAPAWAPAPPRPAAAPRTLRELLTDAQTVLFGFDGPLTRLFTAQGAREAALHLLGLVAELRDPEDALAGRPLGVESPREGFPHPLDVLRAFAHDPLGPLLRARLDELELRAVPDAPATHRSATLARTLHHTGRRVAVVTDVCEQAVRRCLAPYDLPLAGLHGRTDDLTRLMPDPSCLLRALEAAGRPAATGLLITSSPAEVTAARRIGVPCVGLARNPTAEQRLRETGCDVTVSSLNPLLNVARSL